MPPDSSFTSDSERELVSIKQCAIQCRRNSTGPKYFCSISGCNESFKRMDQLDRHEYRHTGVHKHICTYEGCDKTYSILTHLKRHLRTTHERTAPTAKNIACLVEECGKLFQSEANMQRHIREVHENPKVYNCSFCNEKFTQKLKMRRHEISKHTKEYPYNCTKCSKGFYQQYNFEKHVPSCKIYPCTGCELKFDKWSNYITHCKETQHGRKYYNCEHCKRVYAKAGELQRHIMLQHTGADLALNFKCTHEGCDRAYAYEKNLKQHIRTTHGGKRFECTHEDCKKGFSSAQNLQKHIKREHSSRKRTHSGSCSKNETIENGNETISKKIKQPRRKRKDAGKPKLSKLAVVAGIAVEHDFHKLLCEREADAIKTVEKHLLENVPQNSTSGSELDDINSKHLRENSKDEARPKFDTTQVKANEEAELKANNETPLRANEETPLKANEEAQLKASKETPLRANEVTPPRTNEETPLRANEEAQLKTNEEAQLRANEEAQLKANKETPPRANEETPLTTNEEEQLKANKETPLTTNEEVQLEANEDAQLEFLIAAAFESS